MMPRQASVAAGSGNTFTVSGGTPITSIVGRGDSALSTIRGGAGAAAAGLLS